MEPLGRAEPLAGRDARHTMRSRIARRGDVCEERQVPLHAADRPVARESQHV